MLYTCPNCGATYDSDEKHRICPYCGMEQTEQVIDDTIDYINKLNEETKDYRTLPERTAEKKRLGATLIFLVLIVAGVLIIGITAIVLKLNNLRTEKNTEVYLAELERLYESGDYDALREYYYDHVEVTYSDTFKKYDDIAYMENVLSSIQYYESNRVATAEMEEELYEDYHDSSLYSQTFHSEIINCMQILWTCQEADERDYPFDNPEDYEYYREEVFKIFRDQYGFTEEELWDGVEIFLEHGSFESYQEQMWENRYEM